METEAGGGSCLGRGRFTLLGCFLLLGGRLLGRGLLGGRGGRRGFGDAARLGFSERLRLLDDSGGGLEQPCQRGLCLGRVKRHGEGPAYRGLLGGDLGILLDGGRLLLFGSFLGAGAFFSLGAAAFFSLGSFLGAGFLTLSVASFLTAGLAAFLASFVPPEAPAHETARSAKAKRDSAAAHRRPATHGRPLVREGDDVPLGCSKTPFSTPFLRALLKSESNMASVTVMLLLALTYFLSDWRLWRRRAVSNGSCD